MSSTTSTTAAAGADFTQLSAHALEQAIELGMEIVGCARGFNAFKDGEIISPDHTAAEIEVWLDGYGRALVAVSAQHRAYSAPEAETRFTDVEFTQVMDQVRYRGWNMLADHSGVKINGPSFVTHAASSAEFFSFISGFNAAGAALGLLGTGAPMADGDVE